MAFRLLRYYNLSRYVVFSHEVLGLYIIMQFMLLICINVMGPFIRMNIYLCQLWSEDQAKSQGKPQILGANPSVERQPELRLCDVVESVPGIAGFKVRVEDPVA